LFLDMAAHQLQAQLGNLLEETFDATIFLDPSSYLLGEVDRHIDGVALSPIVVGQLKGAMLVATMTVTRRRTAHAIDFEETGLQEGLAAGQAFQAAGQHAPQIRGVPVHAHTESSQYAFTYIGKSPKSKGAKKK
jgi:hypothetical protein